MNLRKTSQQILITLLILWGLAGCSPYAATPTSSLFPTRSITPTAEARPDGLTDDEAASLSSLEQMDDYPLYTMRYYGTYNQRELSMLSVEQSSRLTPDSSFSWACSLYAAFGDSNNMLYGRNFDWDYSPAVLLFTDPPDGYASVSMVDIAYLGFGGTKAGTAVELPLTERRSLLGAPSIPFDGMNEHGLVVGMAAVPPGEMRPDPTKETIGSLGVIREMLDHARGLDEAMDILKSYNVDMEGGPPLHYLMADSSGRSALVEFYKGEMVIIPNEMSWQPATNFLRSSAGESPQGMCWRYDRLSQRLQEADGRITTQGAMDLLAEVAQGVTQWSVVYDITTGDINVVMGQEYDHWNTFHLDLAER